ncbi:MAG: TonB-dependent receptor [Chitinophagaceae bacterium]|nr:MAG: TonB-dependent receptor [Chitinophagaceae bacterium]
MTYNRVYHTCLCLFMAIAVSCPAQERDSTAILDPVQVSGAGKRNSFTGSIPSQTLDRRTLNQLNATSAGDAAKYFSGVLVRDYGGAGGLKTISVRSLGATHTGLLYDGIPVSDVQTGQTDLGRFSTGFLRSLDIFQANTQLQPAPARSFASAAVLSMTTKTFTPPVNHEWFAGLRQGSFGFWQPFAGTTLRIGNNLHLQVNTELTRSDGRYPVNIDNGVLTRKSKRINTDLDSWQSEASILKLFKDSSTLQVKVFNYLSDRGLPAGLTLGNEQSKQRLFNSDQFVQARYLKNYTNGYSLLLSGKASQNYTRYTDPLFQNNAGGLDNRYRQSEYYLSAAISKIIRNVRLSYASDIAITDLNANTSNFAYPTRTSLWNNFAGSYAKKRWQIDGSLLLTTITDRTRTGIVSRDRNKLTPTLSASYRPGINSPFLIRAFYKEVFRMPGFNDLYYILVGNSNLRPEQARQYNAGFAFNRSYDHNIRSIRLSADAYLNRIDDKIVAVPAQNLFVWTMLNLGKVDIKGIDLTGELEGRFSQTINWFARVAYTWQQAKNITDKAAGNYRDRIPYTPDHSGSGIFSIAWKQWNTGISALFSGNRYGLGDNSAFTQLRGWGTQDLFISRFFLIKKARALIRGELNNIGDQRYEVVRAYPMPGRAYRISITFSNQ